MASAGQLVSTATHLALGGPAVPAASPGASISSPRGDGGDVFGICAALRWGSAPSARTAARRGANEKQGERQETA